MNLRKITKFRWIEAEKRRRKKLSKVHETSLGRGLVPPVNKNLLRIAERMRTPLSQNLISRIIIQEHLRVADLFQDGVFVNFLKFSYLKLFLNIKRPFLSQIIILESIIQFKDQLRVKSRAVKIKVKSQVKGSPSKFQSLL